MRRVQTVIALAIAWGAAACDDATPIAGPCMISSDCDPGFVCVNGGCEPEPTMTVDLDSGITPRDVGFAPRPDVGIPDSGPDAGFADATVMDAASMDAAAPQDTGFIDATPPVDLGFIDAAPPIDAGFADAAPPHDAGFIDATPPIDAGFTDAQPVDLGFVDAGFMDAQPVDTGPPPVPQPGIYDYGRILTPGIPRNVLLTRINVSPDGRTALIGASYDRIYVFDIASNSSTISIPLPKDTNENISVEAIEHSADGRFALIAATAIFGTNNAQGRLYRSGPHGEGLVELTAVRGSGRYFRSISVNRFTGAIRVQSHPAQTTPSNIALHVYDDTTRTFTGVDATFTSAGCTGSAFVQDGLGGTGVAYVCGINGITLGILDSTGVFANGPGFGQASNTHRIEARPQQDYALTIEDGSTSKLSRFDQGVWTTGFSAANFSHTGMRNLAFSDDGLRLLAVGNVFNDALRVREYRHGFYASNQLADVSIPNFNLAPYLGTSSVSMHDAAWRPGRDCGYIVGGRSNFQGTDGFLIRFEVLNGYRGCP